MKRILVCDDDHEIVQAICVYLTDAGFEIVQAYSGKEALQCVLDPDQQIDLIIMDVMMPEVNGIEATKKIRELYNIPIIMLSAKSEDEDKITGLKIGADDYMTKPFNPEELVARVESQLRRIEMIREGKNKRSNVIRIGGLECCRKAVLPASLVQLQVVRKRSLARIRAARLKQSSQSGQSIFPLLFSSLPLQARCCCFLLSKKEHYSKNQNRLAVFTARRFFIAVDC